MSGQNPWWDPRIAIVPSTGIGVAALAHVADRLATVDRYSRWPVTDVRATVQRRPVTGYGEMVRIVASVGTAAGTVRVRADGDCVCTAVDKARDRLCLQLARHDARDEQPRSRWRRLRSRMPWPPRIRPPSNSVAVRT